MLITPETHKTSISETLFPRITLFPRYSVYKLACLFLLNSVPAYSHSVWELSPDPDLSLITFLSNPSENSPDHSHTGLW